MPELKRGRLSVEEQKFIREKAASLSVEDIAITLNRTVEPIKKWMKQNFVSPKPLVPKVTDPAQQDKMIIREELRSSMAWKRLKDEFSSEEMKFFEEEYVKLCSQFREDVLPTEENQIIKAIRFDILIHRNMAQRQRSLKDIENLEKMQESVLSRAGGDASSLEDGDRDKLLDIETQLQAAKAADQQRTKELTDLESKHQALMKDLKATREQRFNRIETGRGFLSVIKDLEVDARRRQQAEINELMRRATDYEIKRLGTPHKYEDNNEDLPILSAETLEALDKRASDDDE